MSTEKESSPIIRRFYPIFYETKNEILKFRKTTVLLYILLG